MAFSLWQISLNFWAPLPKNNTLLLLKNSENDSSERISARVSRICFFSELNTAEYTSILRASSKGIIKQSSRCTCRARTSNVGVEINGRSNAKQSPFAAETPMRRPVYDPGPLLTATAFNWHLSILASFNTSSIKTCNFSAWENFKLFSSRMARMFPFTEMATEQLVVAVSRHRMVATIYPFYWEG